LPEVRKPRQAAFLRGLLRAFAREHAAPLDPLTPQELRVLGLLAAGRTNPEIARELVVSINTVKAHLKSIYRKLDVESRLAASQAASQLGLI
jgi:LuxR family maltose regulon positive regulatory protein